MGIVKSQSIVSIVFSEIYDVHYLSDKKIYMIVDMKILRTLLLIFFILFGVGSCQCRID
jgi:hypothetical protein